MALELRGITKQFPGVLANDNINLKVEAGELADAGGSSLTAVNTTGKSPFSAPAVAPASGAEEL